MYRRRLSLRHALISYDLWKTGRNPNMVNVEVHGKRPTKRAMRTADMRRRIVDESVKLFIEQGYEKTTTRQILQKVGILNGSLYNIYRSKEDIFADIILIAMRQMTEQIGPILPDKTSPAVKLAMLLDVELHICSKSTRIAELASIAHGKWEIHKRLAGQLTEWLSKMDVSGDLHTDSSEFSLRLDACLAVSNVFVERMFHEPETVDLRQAMVINARSVADILGAGDADVEGEVDELIDRLVGRQFVICDLRL